MTTDGKPGQPDSRGWVFIGLLALTFYIISLLAFVPGIQTNEVFKILATAIVSGAFCGGGVAFYFNTTQGSAAKDSAMVNMAAGDKVSK